MANSTDPNPYPQLEKAILQYPKQWNALVGGETEFVAHFIGEIEKDPTKRAAAEAFIMEKAGEEVPAISLKLTRPAAKAVFLALENQIRIVGKRIVKYGKTDHTNEEGKLSHQIDKMILDSSILAINSLKKMDVL